MTLQQKIGFVFFLSGLVGTALSGSLFIPLAAFGAQLGLIPYKKIKTSIGLTMLGLGAYFFTGMAAVACSTLWAGWLLADKTGLIAWGLKQKALYELPHLLRHIGNYTATPAEAKVALQKIKRCIEDGAPVNTLGFLRSISSWECRYLPLQVAAKYGDIALIDFLVARGADVNEMSAYVFEYMVRRPIEIAFWKNHWDAVKKIFSVAPGKLIFRGLVFRKQGYVNLNEPSNRDRDGGVLSPTLAMILIEAFNKGDFTFVKRIITKVETADLEEAKNTISTPPQDFRKACEEHAIACDNHVAYAQQLADFHATYELSIANLQQFLFGQASSSSSVSVGTTPGLTGRQIRLR